MEETVLMVLIILHVIVPTLDIVETCVNVVSITTENTQAVIIICLIFIKSSPCFCLYWQNDKSMTLSTDVLYNI